MTREEYLVRLKSYLKKTLGTEKDECQYPRFAVCRFRNGLRL
jgi:uncharacterized membrane protein